MSIPKIRGASALRCKLEAFRVVWASCWSSVHPLFRYPKWSSSKVSAVRLVTF